MLRRLKIWWLERKLELCHKHKLPMDSWCGCWCDKCYEEATDKRNQRRAKRQAEWERLCQRH